MHRENVHTSKGDSEPAESGRRVAEATQHAMVVLRNRMAPIIQYLDDPRVQEVMINAPGDIWIEREGEIKKINVELSDNAVRSSLQALAFLNDKSLLPTAREGKDVIMDCRMGSMRVAAALPPVAINGYAICIRKHSRSNRRLSDYFGDQDINNRPEYRCVIQRPDDTEVAKGGAGFETFLRWLVGSRANVIISGGTSSGKTTFLNALVAEIDIDHRIITIEDTPELQVTHPNRVQFCANEELGVDIHRLVRLTLRFRPERIIVGEVRGAEAFDLLDVLNTGHSGGFCSLHANSASMALSRLVNMLRKSPDAKTTPVEALRAQIAETFNFVIHTARIGNWRGPVEVLEILGMDDATGRYLTRTVFSLKGALHVQ